MARGGTRLGEARRLWYRLALARSDGTRILAAAQGEHLGVAIAAAEGHHRHARAVAAIVCAENEIPLGDSVDKSGVVELGADPTPAAEQSTYAFPLGVLPQLGTEAALATARSGWVVRPNAALFVVEAQVTASELVDAYLGLLERLPGADNLEVKVLDHFEDAATTDVWLTSRVNAKRILRFLDDHDVELLHNGHVEVAVYLRAQKATLRLTEHKTIVWVADNRDHEADLAKWMGELKIPAQDPHAWLSAVPHFHWRAVASKDRQKLSAALERQRLRRVDTVRRLTAG